MRSVVPPTLLMVLALGIATAAGDEKPLRELDQSKLFLKTNCVSCHGNKKSEGDHNFETFSDKDWNDQELLNDLLTVLKEEEMPPEDAEKKPSAKEVIAFEQLLAKQYLAISKRSSSVSPNCW